MSIESWKAQYYPKKAKKATHSPKAATKHSLRKWKGLTPEALKEHGLHHVELDDYITETTTGDTFKVSSKQCALCMFDNKVGNGECDVCPLFKVDRQACWQYGSPYETWVDTGNAEPMIKALKQTYKAVKAGEV